MTISVSTTRIQYDGDGTIVTFAYPFKILEDSDLQVISSVAAGTETVLVLNTDYTVTGAGTSSGGNVVLTAGSLCPLGSHLTILRNMDLLQSTDYVDGDAFSAESVEDALDKLVMTQQQLGEAIGRSFKWPKASTATGPVLPNASSNGYLGWNAGATALENKSAPVAVAGTQYEVDALVSYGGGTSYTQATIEAAAAAVGSSASTVLLRPGVWVITSNMNLTTLSPNATYKLVKGTTLDIATGVTVTIPKMDENGLHKRFTLVGTGAVAFSAGAVKASYVDWFVADADKATSAICSAAAQAAIAALPANGGMLGFGVGTYVLDAVAFPADPKVVSIQLPGINETIFQMGSAAGPMFHKVHSASRITGAHFSGFTIKAHASSDKTNSAHMAWEVAGWGASTWERIAYKSNGTGSVFALFDLSSDTYLTYRNTIRNIVSTGNVGPRSIVYTHATTSANNTNDLTVQDFWIYANSGMTAVVDLSSTTEARAVSNSIEENTGAHAFVLGQAGYYNNNWIENNFTNFAPSFAPLVGADWTFGTDGTGGWAASGNTIVKTASAGTQTATPSGTFTILAGKFYQVTIVCSAAANSPTYTLGGTAGTTITATTITDYIRAGTTAKLIISGGATATATITSITVREADDFLLQKGAAPYSGAPYGTVVSASNTIGKQNYVSGGTGIYAPEDCVNNTIESLSVGDMQEYTTGTNKWIHYITDPAIPTISRLAGGTGTLAYTSAGYTKHVDPYTRLVAYNLLYAWTPGAATPTEFGISAITGYTLISTSVGCGLDSDGTPQPVSMGWPTEVFWVTTATTGAHSIALKLLYQKDK